MQLLPIRSSSFLHRPLTDKKTFASIALGRRMKIYRFKKLLQVYLHVYHGNWHISCWFIHIISCFNQKFYVFAHFLRQFTSNYPCTLSFSFPQMGIIALPEVQFFPFFSPCLLCYLRFSKESCKSRENGIYFGHLRLVIVWYILSSDVLWSPHFFCWALNFIFPCNLNSLPARKWIDEAYWEYVILLLL